MFKNRLRLPIYISRPQYPAERNVFRKADGASKVLSMIIRNTYQGITEYLPEAWHRKLVIALSHDTVTIENERYLTDIVLDSEYAIQWQDFKDFPIAQAGFTVQSTPFDATNSNCQSCEDASQLSLVDDTFPNPLDQGGDDCVVGLFDNDSICCYPYTASLVWWNTDYLISATLTMDDNGRLCVVMKDSILTANGVLVATYRVTCPDGSYDEANVYADFTGSATACPPPPLVSVSSVTDTTAHVAWTAPTPPPASGYVWALYDASNPVTSLQSGSTGALFVDLTGLVPDFNYMVQVYARCNVDGDNSVPVSEDFTTTGTNTNCAEFQVVYDLPDHDPTVGSYSYLDCNSVIQTVLIASGGIPQSKCMLINEGDVVPYYFEASVPEISYTFIDLC